MKLPTFITLFTLLLCCAHSNRGAYAAGMHLGRGGAVWMAVAPGARAPARLTLASYYMDHMVLQQAPQQAVVWGTFPDVGDRIIIKVAGLGKTYTHGAVVEPGPTPGVGVWTVTLDPMPAGGPYAIDAYADDGARVSIRDVLFGDVWLCSGQSNMQFSTDQIFNASEELKGASKFKDIRLLTVAMEYSSVPLPDLRKIVEPWSLPNATTVGKSPFNYFSAVCWLFGKQLYEARGYPIGLVDTTWGGTPVEAWSSPDALAHCGVTATTRPTHTLEEMGPSSNSELWNAMVYPLLKMTIYGAIWYQGEADSTTPVMRDRYNCTFPAMIDDWRLKFSAASRQTRPDFPFGFVQLSGNRPDMSITVGFPDIRWHQTADYGYVPNPRMKRVFMSVAMDLPDFTSPWGSIHPRDKQDVAARLFLAGMAVAYDARRPLVQGPRPARVTQHGGAVALTYPSTTAITVRSREGFEFCCTWNGRQTCSSKNAWWLPAPVLNFTASAIVLDGTVCGPRQSIVGIRYAWRESPCVFKQCAVYSYAHDIPGPPYISLKPSSAGGDFTYDIDWSQPQFIPQ
ncbi:hypothetical protein ACOMHN_008885 [Nucella lapillus]